MYTKKVPYKDFLGRPRTETVNYNLTEVEVFRLLPEFQRVFEWRSANEAAEYRELEPDEVVAFYTDFERILLAAWGIPSDDGRHFRKSGRYDFEESALFNASMLEFVADPKLVSDLLEQIIPKGLAELVEKADANLAALAASESSDAALQAEIARLRAQVAQQNDAAPTA